VAHNLNVTLTVMGTLAQMLSWLAAWYMVRSIRHDLGSMRGLVK
jgi:hypothetical protein